MTRIFGILIFCLVSTTFYGQFVYVDQKVEQPGDGTKAKPFKTIQEAANVATAGSTVRILDGIYREYVQPKHKGKKGSYITYEAINPGKVVVSGADIVSAWEKLEGKREIYTADWSTYFEINTNDYTHHDDRWGRADLAVVDGKLMVFCESMERLQNVYDSIQKKTATRRLIGNEYWTAPNVNDPYSWAGAFYNDIETKKSYIWLKGFVPPVGHTVELGARKRTFGDLLWEKNSSYIHLKNLIFRHTPTFPQRPSVGLNGEGNLVTGCVIEDNAGGGIIVNGSIKNSVIQRNGHIGGQANRENYQTVWRQNSWKPISRSWEAGGTKVITADGAIFNQCAFVHNGGPGLWFDIDNNDCKIFECVFYENEGPGLYYEISHDAQIFNNLCIRNAVFKVQVEDPKLGWGYGGIMIGESYNVNIYNNTCVGNKDGIGIREVATDRFGGGFAGGPNKEELPYWSHNITVANNLLANNSRKADEKGGLGFGIGLWYATENFGPNDWESNDAPEYDQWVNTLAPSVKQKDPANENFVFHNNYIQTAPENSAVQLGVVWKRLSKKFKTVADFENQTVWKDVGKDISTAGFVDPANDNYQLKKNSEAYQKNVGWKNPPADIFKWIQSITPEYAK